MTELTAGSVLGGRYEIERRLGEGGMGVVYAAFDRRIERGVALKAILGAQSSAATRSLLRTEAKAIGALAHPGVVALHDLFEEGDDLVLVMELVQGKSLRERLSEGALPLDEIARIVVDVASALGAAHEKGLVHRDVKPDNIMLRDDGRIALLDFGIAKVLGASGPIDPAGRTGKGELKGTPAYLSPEQVLGVGITEATDQFALGVVAYELVAGRRPWPEDNFAALLSAILDGSPPPIRREGAAVAEVERSIVRALAKKGEDRHPTIGAFADALARSVSSNKEVGGVSPAAVSMGAAKPELPFARTELEAPAPVDVQPKRSRSIAGVLLAGAAFAALAALAAKTAPPPHAQPATLSSSPKQPAPVRSFSPTGSESARSELIEAVRLLSRSSPRARDHVNQAIASDGSFASARVERALLDQVFLGVTLDVAWRAPSDDEAREDVRVALDARATLPPRDAALVDVLELLVRDPPDYRRSAELLKELGEAFPLDPEVPFLRGIVDNSRLHSAEALADHHRAAEIDRSSTFGLWAAAIAESDDSLSTLESFDLGAAMNDVTACMTRDRTSIACRLARAQILLLTGRCSDAEVAAREISSLDPESSSAFDLRATAVAGQGGAHEAIAKLLDESLHRLHGDALVAFTRMTNSADLAKLDGDFIAARAAVQSYFARDPTNAVDEGEELRLEDFDFEAGESKRGADEAQKQLALASARPAPIFIYADRTPVRLLAMRIGGRITASDYLRRVFTWLDGWRAKVDLSAWAMAAGNALLFPYGLFSQSLPSIEEASAVLDGLRVRGCENDRRWPASQDNAGMGVLLLAAGRLDEAQRFLEWATEGCAYGSNASYLHLGQVHARKGDQARACTYYARAVSNWAHAKPKSVTADTARAEAKKLGCTAVP